MMELAEDLHWLGSPDHHSSGPQPTITGVLERGPTLTIFNGGKIVVGDPTDLFDNLKIPKWSTS